MPDFGFVTNPPAFPAPLAADTTRYNHRALIGRTLAHYRITAKVGEGGMGEVYRATDTRLGREVAIKVLSAELAASQERLERFQREARALAALDHPGIVTVYSVEEADGLHFLTMQLVEGEPLDHLIPGKGLGVDRILEIGAAVAEALAAAHEKGIVHRDLKPANIMVARDGRVKVLDFGLAKIAASPSDETLDTQMATALQTREGIVMGTVPYMSPEQVAGRAVDPRTDLFSLGVVLYEMATGVRPFMGQSSAELASAILRDRPGPLAELRSDLPRGLAGVIERCLEKDPEARFATARALCEGLEAATSEPPPVETELTPISRAAAVADSGATRTEEGFWVAVLPFRYTGADADLAALVEGLSEEIVTGLSRFSYLRVIARSSTERHASGVADARALGEELGARYVMQGSLRHAGSTLRITAQLVDAVSGAHLWAESYHRPFVPDKFFELQDDVGPRIVSTVADMNGVLPHSMSELLRHRDPQGLSPYEAVLRGFGYLERIEAEEHAVVRSALERAVEQAPDQADAWAMLSMMYAEEHKHGFNTRPDPLDRALEAARRAVAAAPSNHLGYHMLAQALFFRRELAAFRNAADRAVALNPMDGCTTAFMGILMAYAGDWDHGCALTERAMELNPHHPGWYRFSAFFNAYRQEDYRAALDVALKFNMPSYFYTHAAIAAAHGQLGEREAAEGALEELLAQKPDFATSAREEFGKWVGAGELLESFLDGLRKAGLEVPEAGAAPPEAESPRDRVWRPPPRPPTPLLGREASLETAAGILGGGARVLTVTGHGGTGKTRFAIELFQRMEPGYADGAAFVSLASVTAATEVLPTVSVALDIAEAQGRSALEALATVIADRRVLLILDNLEQVLDAAADIAELVSRCPLLQIIATSRARLKIGSESEFALPPLEVPPSGTKSLEKLGRSPSVALLLQRAKKVRPGLELTPANAEAIVAICRRLNGLPLALELAAARLRILDPAALLARLDNALDVLTSGDRDLPLRQRTLRATLAWSYSLLDPHEQRLLRCVSVFHEGWTIEAIEHVSFREEERYRALDELDSLVEKGLVSVVGAGGRYALLETIRAFSAEQLEASGETVPGRDAHADYYLEFASEIAAAMRGPAQREAMSRARADHANTLAAARWFTSGARRGDATALEKGLLLCGHLNWFWHIGGHHMTGRALLDELLALAAEAAPSRGRALARLAAGMISTVTGEWERSLEEWTGGYEDGLVVGDEEVAAEGSMGVGYCHLSGGRMDEARTALAEATSRSSGGVNDFIHALSMTLEGMRLFATGDLEGGIALVEQARQIQQRLDDCEGGGVALSFLAQMISAKGDQERALELYRDALALFESIGDHPEIARVLCETGWAALAAADVRGAQDAFRRAVHAYEVVGSPRGTGLALLGLAAVEAAAGRSERAVAIAAAAQALSERAGVVVEHPMAPDVVDRIEALKASIPKTRLDGIVTDGSELSPAAILAMLSE
jgi:non-specific serine/threonine protein kinase